MRLRDLADFHIIKLLSNSLVLFCTNMTGKETWSLVITNNNAYSEYLLVVALGDETGRLLRYDRRAGRVAVLHSDLPYPNGVAVGADGTHVVVAHTGLSELRRYWVRGPRAGRNETFAELPGYPDNVRTDGRGGYWVALTPGVSFGGDDAAAAEAPVVAVRVSANGKVVEALDGFSFVSVSEVAERNGTLWVGSVDTPYAGEVKRHMRTY
jgi:hypothetical protein